MDLKELFTKQGTTKTPLLIKIVIILQFWLLLGGLSHFMLKSNLFMVFYSTLTICIQALALIAIWNLRKWGIIAYAVMIILGFFSAYPVLSQKAILALIVIRVIPLLLVLIYWKKMT